MDTPLMAAEWREVPASATQRGLWYMAGLEGIGATHSVARTIRLRGRLDVPALTRSIQYILDRHDALRTVFADCGGHCQARVVASVTFALPLIDLSGLPPSIACRNVESGIVTCLRQPFDLARGPLMRGWLFRLQPDDHLVLLNFHHIVIDAAAITVFRRELAAGYQAFSAGLHPALPPLSIQFSDYVRRQDARLSPDHTQSLLDYWRAALDGAPLLSTIPPDVPRPPVQTFQAGQISAPIPPSLLALLRDLRAAEGTTLFTTFLAAFHILLMRMSGQDDTVIGVSHVDRKADETRSLIGCLVNMLPVRARMEENPSFRTFLRQVSTALRAAVDHHELPFATLVERLFPQHHAAYPPVLQTSIRLLHEDTGDLELTGLEQDYQIVPSDGTAYDLTLFVDVGAVEGWCRLEYNRTLFSDASIQRLIRRFLVLLEGIVSNPDAPIGSLPLLEPSEYGTLVRDWNTTAQEFPADCVHQIFEKQAGLTPERTALETGEARWTYRELNALANRLARRLRELGVGPDVCVALCAERSVDMVVGLLAILKAGGGYTPIDPDYPCNRVTFMLRESGAPLLLTQARLIPRLAVPEGLAIECLDSWTSRLPQDADASDDPPPVVRGEHLAYLIFTSGSTGQPKGVRIPHRGISNNMRWMQAAFPIGPDDAVLQKSPFGFDASVWEFFLPWLTGGRLVLAHRDAHRDPAALVDAVIHHGITILMLVPSLLDRLLEEPRFKACRSLRQVFVGGETLTADLARRFCRSLDADLCNLYGPTEVTINATYYRVNRDRIPDPIPIGRPVANTQAYILNAQLNPVPVGAVGELCLGGIQVGLGYRNRPDLTAERFVPDPFAGRAGAWLYRTGDCARYRADGNIEFLGRGDRQVKVRGYRIELGEVEYAIVGTGMVRQTVAMADRDATGGTRLTAFCIAADGVTPSALGKALKATLPPQMIPRLVFVESLPLTAHGKIDQAALRATIPDIATGPAADAYPRSERELVLLGLFKELLGTETVGIHDDFFEAGGHSLMAMRLLARIRLATGLRLTPALLFEHPTVAGLATTLMSLEQNASTDHADGTPWSFLVPVKSGTRNPLFFMVGGDGGEGSLLVYARLARYLAPGRPFYGFKETGMDGRAGKPHRTVRAMAADFLRELRQVQPSGPYMLAGGCIGGLIAYEMASQLRDSGEQVSRLILLDTPRPSARSYGRQLVHAACSHIRFGMLLALFASDFGREVARRLRAGRLSARIPAALAAAQEGRVGLRRRLAQALPRLILFFYRHDEGSPAAGFYEALPSIGPRRYRFYLRASSGLPYSHKEADPGLLTAWLRFAATLHRYRPKPYDDPVDLLVCEEMAARTEKAWRSLLGDHLTVHVVPGDHETYIRDGIAETGRVLNDILEGSR